ncbi:hypothetical protein [Brevundimonas sp.]|jgi:hypothetical protein|nr:hypothetical protein [Brevundimonas sp.]
MEILIGLFVLLTLCGLVGLAFQPLGGPRRFRDVNRDGEPD